MRPIVDGGRLAHGRSIATPWTVRRSSALPTRASDRHLRTGRRDHHRVVRAGLTAPRIIHRARLEATLDRADNLATFGRSGRLQGTRAESSSAVASHLCPVGSHWSTPTTNDSASSSLGQTSLDRHQALGGRNGAGHAARSAAAKPHAGRARRPSQRPHPAPQAPAVVDGLRTPAGPVRRAWRHPTRRPNAASGQQTPRPRPVPALAGGVGRVFPCYTVSQVLAPCRPWQRPPRPAG